MAGDFKGSQICPTCYTLCKNIGVNMKPRNAVIALVALSAVVLMTACETGKERKHEHHSGNPSHPNHKTVPNR